MLAATDPVMEEAAAAAQLPAVTVVATRAAALEGLTRDLRVMAVVVVAATRQAAPSPVRVLVPAPVAVLVVVVVITPATETMAHHNRVVRLVITVPGATVWCKPRPAS